MKETILDSPTVFSKDDILRVINNLPLAVAVIDADRKLVLANKMAGMFVKKEENLLVGPVVGAAFGCIHHKDAPEGCGFGKECLKCKLRITVNDTLENERGHFMVETPMTFNSIGRRHLRITTQPLKLQKGKAVLLSIEDVTQAKKYEHAKIEKEKLTVVVRTAGAICHEINQPLMAILGFSELLIDDICHGQVQKENIKEIKDQAERLAEITNKLMAITQYKTKKYLHSEILDLDAASSFVAVPPNPEKGKNDEK
ncbi:histidine kinase [Desulfobacter hydrogenophilus]|uniref:histidine kinase n=1 Tax=Desulfobacter hydrogenophilus TaxID=2291 RepID=A0A328FIA7_9BACT|nr:histidine kinase dimerization/phospho-acceptor domain-containing protein [Desulfobacter hydrogenophilus]NDY70630.1 histidine kinase [Desulfobacter hydrogenophilus]QBH13995.1 histidine kinase [Desulfobacter hydrogenophilus]RAM03590.1 histidine kinase [Desulfobacter hydrogenophilus]